MVLRHHADDQQKMFSQRQGFTLIELMLVTGIIAILAGIISSALNIPLMLVNTRDAERKQNMKTIENAMYQHLVDEWELANGQNIPEGEENAKEICIKGLTIEEANAENCVQLDALVDKDFIAALPRDPLETNEKLIGYTVYKHVGRPRIVADHIGELSEGGGGGGATCGDGLIEGAETCDDDDISPGDGCDASCAIETNWTCTGEPSVCNITSGLAGWWKMDDGAGTIVSDASGNGNHGEMSAGVTWEGTEKAPVSFLNPYAVEFPAYLTNDINAADVSGLNIASDMTITAWVHRDANTDAVAFDRYSAASSASQYRLNWIDSWDGSNPNKLEFKTFDCPGSCASNTVYSSNAHSEQNSWHHIAVVYNSATPAATFYFNGTADGSPAMPGNMFTTTSPTNYIGYDHQSGLGMDGYLDDVRLYNRALSAAEVQAIADGNG